MSSGIHAQVLAHVVACTRTCSLAGIQNLLIPCHRANTMSSALEVLGMSLPYSSSTPALYPGKSGNTPASYNILNFRVREGTGML